ncbi:threonine dehydratase [Roseiarcus fermentans]|uniref:Threonine dehydratase n=1 Tax=Roseiarcus fermentans TaxID=1473586 RepID=A0A366F921_9HYPH|nr:threonine dehydratase [Roseiarcus fermentans]RBP11141.1 threonine dehydratase [Roseiarcus fermentans]
MFSLSELRQAHDLVRRFLPPTPAFAWPLLAARLGAEVVVKHENHQPTGAFKVRGGLTCCDALSRGAPRVEGIVSATRGNHGQSLAFAARRFGLAVTIVAPHGNSAEKNAAMRAFGAELIEHGADFQAAREEAMRLAGARGLHAVPAFHVDLVRGVATWALELLTERPDLDVLYVPIGQGSGICGAIAARDALGLRTEIVGVQSAGAPAYALSFEAGRAVSTTRADTLADGVATRAPDEEAVAIIARGAARVALVTDDEIAGAIRAYWTDTHNLAEGAGAAPLAAALKERARLAGRKVGLVLSGGNIDFDLFQRWVAKAPETAAAA